MEKLSLLSMGSVLDFGASMLIFLVALAALIFVHELGHFLVARRLDVEVEKFSLGFGPKIFSYKPGKTEYLICWIPLGGYVKMKGEDPGEEVADTKGSFSAATVNSRIAIASAGPIFNILFAILIYIVFYMIGTDTLSSKIGTVVEGSAAQAAGLQTGDTVTALDGQQIRFWDELLKIVHSSPGEKMDFTVERNGTILNFSITPMADEVTNMFGKKESVGLIGVAPLARNIVFVEKDSAADKAGVKVGDKIISINEKPVYGLSDLIPAVRDNPGQELAFTFERNGVEQTVMLTPVKQEVKDATGKTIKIGLIGIGLNGDLIREQYGPIGATMRGLEATWDMTYLIMMSLKELIFGSVPKESLGGPILIFQAYEQYAEQGFNQIIWLTALISINLGLLNLLPIPILDGGHIFFFLIEIIKGRPVSEKNRERAAQVGLFMLLSLMAFAFYNDIMRIIG